MNRKNIFSRLRQNVVKKWYEVSVLFQDGTAGSLIVYAESADAAKLLAQVEGIAKVTGAKEYEQEGAKKQSV